MSGYEIVYSSGLTLEANKSTFIRTDCPAGKKAISGGMVLDSGSWTAPHIYGNTPVADGTAWVVNVGNPSDYSINVSGTAVCITAN